MRTVSGDGNHVRFETQGVERLDGLLLGPAGGIRDQDARSRSPPPTPKPWGEKRSAVSAMRVGNFVRMMVPPIWREGEEV